MMKRIAGMPPQQQMEYAELMCAQLESELIDAQSVKTMLDEFAMAAMASYKGQDIDSESLAKAVYNDADAMMEARKGKAGV